MQLRKEYMFYWGFLLFVFEIQIFWKMLSLFWDEGIYKLILKIFQIVVMSGIFFMEN